MNKVKAAEEAARMAEAWASRTGCRADEAAAKKARAAAKEATEQAPNMS